MIQFQSSLRLQLTAMQATGEATSAGVATLRGTMDEKFIKVDRRLDGIDEKAMETDRRMTKLEKELREAKGSGIRSGLSTSSNASTIASPSDNESKASIRARNNQLACTIVFKNFLLVRTAKAATKQSNSSDNC